MKNVKDENSMDNLNDTLEVDHSSSKATRFNALSKKMLKIASKASISMETYEFASEKLDTLLEEVILAK